MEQSNLLEDIMARTVVNTEEIKQKIEKIKEEIDSLEPLFSSQKNKEDFLYELDCACCSLDDAAEILERDAAYQNCIEEVFTS